MHDCSLGCHSTSCSGTLPPSSYDHCADHLPYDEWVGHHLQLGIHKQSSAAAIIMHAQWCHFPVGSRSPDSHRFWSCDRCRRVHCWFPEAASLRFLRNVFGAFEQFNRPWSQGGDCKQRTPCQGQTSHETENGIYLRWECIIYVLFIITKLSKCRRLKTRPTLPDSIRALNYDRLFPMPAKPA